MTHKIERESNVHSKEVVLLITVDDYGYPNIALLSFLDIALVSPKKLLFAIGEGSSTKTNLVRTGKATIIIWVGKDAGIYYLKGNARLLRERLDSRIEGFACSAFSMTLRTVSQDHSEQAKLMTTITYDPRRINRSHVSLFRELQGMSKKH